ncbi:ABC transporter [Berryella intestinalis]|uniref:ABC transporter n=1 Tax=Berryella intestinalis TaxID=1531429 RepID=A0A0A8B4W6_9ACTN|nr:ABC transporter ATP-binding protein [Berryella intestinalis]AJC12399.1 ABC transporter [Berryella intestinalis]
MGAAGVRLDRVSFSYRGAPETVHDVSLSVEGGECVVLCGPSGGGKTTVIRLINGLAGGYYEGEARGRVEIGGTRHADLPAWKRAESVGSVFQDPASQFFSSQLAGEIAFSCENLGYDRDTVVSLTDGSIAAFGLDGLRGTPNDRLSSGQKQKVAIASAVAPRPLIVAMDEPSSNLDEEAAMALGRTVAQMKAEGYALVIAEHRIAYLEGVADRFHYVRDGRIERSFTPAQMEALPLEQRRALGLRSTSRAPRPALPRPLAGCGAQKGACALSLRGVSAAFGARRVLQDVSFSVSSGQIVALTGKNGAGKTTLARIVAGLSAPRGGTVEVGGARRTRRALRRLVWFSPNDVRAEFFSPSVQEEVMLLVDPADENRERARRVLEGLGLWDLRERYPSTLSGGQKQRLSIACGLVMRRPVLVLDEPTSGLDALSMEKLSASLRFAAQEGQAILVITHDNEFLGSCCTHCFELGE